MSIEKGEIITTYELYCDVCTESADMTFYDFNEAVEYKKAQGWKSREDDGGWYDICPECLGDKEACK